METRTLYIAGPMSGCPNDNVEAFDSAADVLRAAGFMVVSPAELSRRVAKAKGFSIEMPNFKWDLVPKKEYLLADVTALIDCDSIVMLPGWEESPGACAEYNLAIALHMPTYLYTTEEPNVLLLEDTRKYLPPIIREPPSRFGQIVDELRALHDKKRADYGSKTDPLANVRASEEWGMPAWVGAMVRATDKVRRLQTFAMKGSLANESVVDAFNDLAVYSIIARILYEED